MARRYPYNYARGVGHEQQRHPVLEEFGLPQNGTVTERTQAIQPSEQNQRGAYYF